MNAHQAIAIDGPAASGKSTVAKRIASDWGITMVNSGAMYRAVAWEVLRRGLDPNNSSEVVSLLSEVQWGCLIRDGQTVMRVGEDEPSMEELKSEAVNNAVSPVAAIPEVRALLVSKQREFLELGDLVMEGRDIGSVVFPETPFKFFITANEDVREARRQAEGGGDTVQKRDQHDSQRKTSPLMVAEGAIEIDTSAMSLEDVVVLVKEKLVELGWEESNEE